MVIDIKMCRFDNMPWGFRLVGGSDFEFPLTVVKVTEGSIAEEAGLRVGDVIVRVNDTATSPLTHEEANQIIRHCGNVFYLGVYREEEEDNETSENKEFPILGLENRRTPDSFLDVTSSCKSPMSMTYSEEPDYMPDLTDRPCSVLSENAERKFVEEEIAAVLSGESEVLKEHNVMGIQPKSGVCMSSEVLRELNEEVTKTKMERDKENRKWTTFLQKPNRPIPKSKAQIEAEKHAANAYKVKIVKSAPKSPAQNIVPAVVKEPSPAKELVPPILEESSESVDIKPENEKTVEINQREAPTPTDSDVPSLEDLHDEKPQMILTSETEIANTAADANTDDADAELNTASPTKSIEEKKSDEETESNELATENSEFENASNIENSKAIASVKTEEELALERQLADVQRQLAALSSLPSTIQSTLDAVTKQLADLLPAFKLQQTQTNNNEPRRALQLEKIEENNQEGDSVDDQETNEVKNLESSKEIGDLNQNSDDRREIVETETETPEVNDALAEENDQEVEMLNTSIKDETKTSTEASQMTEEQSLKKQKKYDVIEELEEHLDRKRNPKRSKRAFGPLTPSSERPVVLPGGRRWYRPKDAFNDEFIAEVLSSQAELITGTTLGVNFMKYQKPERKIDLNRSEVYKVIHHLDRQPVRGIEIRPPIVAAEADIRRAVQS